MVCVCVCVSFLGHRTLATEYMADAKRKRAAGVEPEEGDYVRLSPSVEDFMGGKRYCKESELTRCRLLAYERSKGRISECLQLVRVTVTSARAIRRVFS